MSDREQRAAMRKWPTHEEHGEPGFVTCRRSIIEALLDELESAEAGRAAAEERIGDVRGDTDALIGQRDALLEQVSDLQVHVQTLEAHRKAHSILISRVGALAGSIGVPVDGRTAADVLDAVAVRFLASAASAPPATGTPHTDKAQEG